jgi:hypothetical protein
MLKKLLYTILFIALAAGSVYAYQKVGFTRKTAMFFQVVLGNETAMGQGHGGPQMGDNRGGEMANFQPPGGQTSSTDTQGSFSGPPSMAEGGENAAPAHMQQGQAPPSGSDGNGRPGGHGGSGGNISLSNVGLYTVIMSFMVMLTFFMDNWVRNFTRIRKNRIKPAFPLTI